MALGFRDWGQVNRDSIGIIFHSSLAFCSVWGSGEWGSGFVVVRVQVVWEGARRVSVSSAI